MSSSKQKKDKGKAVQRVEDYQLQIPTQNQFTPLNNFPPLPYKTAVTNPSPSNSADAYVIRHIEHLLLTSCNPLLQQISFPVSHKKHLLQTNSQQMISDVHKNSMS